MKYKVVCAWCQKLMKEILVSVIDRNLAGKVSHGICEACDTKMREELGLGK